MFKNLFGSSEPGTSLPDPQPLIQAMHAVALKDTQENRNSLYQQFLKSWLWICVQEIPEGFKEGIGKLAAGTNISVVTPNNAEGLRVLPVFTDQAALANYDPNTPNIALSAREVFKIALNLGVSQVVVNAFDPVRKPIRPGGTVTRREYEALANGLIPQPQGTVQRLSVDKGTHIQIGGCPTPIAPDMKREIAVTVTRFAEVSKIFRYRMRYAESGTISDVLGVFCDPSSARFSEIAKAILSSIQPLLAEGQHLDLTEVRQAKMSLMLKHGELIYEKEPS
jgi:hypothetical protein